MLALRCQAKSRLPVCPGKLIQDRVKSRRASTVPHSHRRCLSLTLCCSFQQTVTTFRSQVSSASGSLFEPDKDRYHLVVALPCSNSHRTLMMRSLKGLQVAHTDEAKRLTLCQSLLTSLQFIDYAFLRTLSQLTMSTLNLPWSMAGYTQQQEKVGLTILHVPENAQDCSHRHSICTSCTKRAILSSLAPYLSLSCG